MDTCDVLNAAKDLLSDKSHWFQGNLTNSKDGIQSGTKWCAIGAIAKVSGIEGHVYPDELTSGWSGQLKYPNAAQAQRTLEAACHDMFNENIVEVNDADDSKEAYAKVMKAYNKAIQDNCS